MKKIIITALCLIMLAGMGGVLPAKAYAQASEAGKGLKNSETSHVRATLAEAGANAGEAAVDRPLAGAGQEEEQAPASPSRRENESEPARKKGSQSMLVSFAAVAAGGIVAIFVIRKKHREGGGYGEEE